MMHIDRRALLRSALFGAGSLGLRSMSSGLPISLLTHPRRALAAWASGDKELAAAVKPQFLIFSTSAMGDPVNANAPGTYDDPNIYHGPDPTMAPTSFALGSTQVKAAKVWSTLPADMRSRLCFFHHGTYTVVHSDERNVLSLMGAANSGEMLPSLVATRLQSALGTLRPQPISLYDDNSEAIAYQGSPLPLLTPMTLAQSIGAPSNGLGAQDLLKMRDDDLNALHAIIKQDGTPAQKAFLDQYATSTSQIRTLQQNLLGSLASITDNSPLSQVKVAIALFQLKVTPVVSIHIPFGGDNHGDVGLGGEAAQHTTGVATLAQMGALLQSAGLGDQVSFVMTNVFGRTMTAGKTTDGRDHNSDHAVSLLMGPGVTGSVIGGVAPKSGADYTALSIDSGSGRGTTGGDITFDNTFAAFGKTVAKAVGLSDDAIGQAIRFGAVVPAALA